MMRIITGSARGVNLETLDGDATRPTSSRVKEAVFSMIQFDIEGRNVLDLFAGSGQLGLEALSRGAAKATFCDSSRDAVAVVMQNAKKTKLFDRCRISACDYTQMLSGIAGRETYHLIFVDPPYASKVIPDVLRRLADGKICAENALIVCESADGDVFSGDEALAARYQVISEKRYAITAVTLLSPRADA